MQGLGAQALERQGVYHAVMALLYQLARALRWQAGPAFLLLASLLGRRSKGVEIIGDQQGAMLRLGGLRHGQCSLLGRDGALDRRHGRGLDGIQAQCRQAFPGIGDAGGGGRQYVCQRRCFLQRGLDGDGRRDDLGLRGGCGGWGRCLRCLRGLRVLHCSRRRCLERRARRHGGQGVGADTDARAQGQAHFLARTHGLLCHPDGITLAQVRNKGSLGIQPDHGVHARDGSVRVRDDELVLATASDRAAGHAEYGMPVAIDRNAIVVHDPEFDFVHGVLG